MLIEYAIFGTLFVILVGCICNTVEKCYYWKQKAKHPESFKATNPILEKEKK